MSLELLKMMIDSACADGIITDTERNQLESKAKELNISSTDLDFLIQTSLDKVRSQAGNSGFKTSNASDAGSGFVTNETTTIASGFVTSNDIGSGFVSNNTVTEQNTIQNKFTDIATLSSQGAMSIVQKARYYGKWVIIKRIKPEFKGNDKYKSLFYKEFENAYHLDHPNIIRLLDKGEDADGVYYTMEYIDGRPLTELITNQGIADKSLIRRIAVQMLDALSYVHKKQVFHRDLKPDNIMVTFKGDNVKLIDFGLASADAFSDDLIKVGTPRYAAPEQQTRGNTIDQRADIYSFGLILLEMLTGQIIDRDTSKLSDRQLANVISRSVASIPENRYSSCEEIIKDISSVSQRQTTAIPASLQEKIKEFAADGVITKNERKVLELEAQANNVDMSVIEAFLGVEIERAQNLMKQKREQELRSEELLKEQERQRLNRERELANQRRSDSESQEHLRRLERDQHHDSGSGWKTAFNIVIVATILILAIVIAKKYSSVKESIQGVVDKENQLYISAKGGLNLRSKPVLENESVLKLYPFGTKVQVLQKDKGWAKVKVGEEEGYMVTQYLSTEDDILDEQFKEFLDE